MAMECIWGVSICPDTLQYKGKTKQNRWKTKRRTRKPKEYEQTPATTAVGTTTVWPWQPPRAVVVTTVQPWWLLVRVAGCFLERRVLASWCIALGRGVFLSLGYFGPLCKLLLILMAQAHTSLAWIHLKHFSPKRGLNHRNLQ